MRYDDNNILCEKVLSTKYASSTEALNTKGINIKFHPADWLNIFYLLNSKDRHIQKR